MKPEDFIMMPIPASQFAAVCALLGGASVASLIATPQRVISRADNAVGKSADVDIDVAANGAGEPSSGGAEASPLATDTASDPNDIDAGGHPWNAELHAGTKGKTKDGYWRMKVGVSRPDPLPGFPKSDAAPATGTSSETSTPSATSQTATDQGSGQPDTSAGEDDEFAAFRAAAAASDATDAAAAASVPARTFSDADLGALCNQAAVKLGDPGPIKEIIGRYIPEGQVAHSRNIPADKREAFAQEVETKAGIQFAA